jgi:PBP1b-binding outer membrane lipoprotein LpoB
MLRAAAVFLFMLLLAGCIEEKPTQPVNEMIESPLQNTVISSFYDYPPRPVTEADTSTPTGCTGRQALRLLSSEGEADSPLLTEPE